MGLNMTNPTTAVAVQATNDGAASTQLATAAFNITDVTNKMREELVASGEADRLLSTVNVFDINTVEAFGNDAAMRMGTAADGAMADMNRAMLFEDQTGGLMNSLRKIMDAVDIKEINKKPGLFENIKKKIEKLLAQYQSIGTDIDKIYVQLKEYENEANQANKKLDVLFNGNVETFKEVQKYIVAGEMGCEELQKAIADKQKEFETTNDPAIRFDLDQLNNALTLFERKVASLRTAESYAMQNIPMIKVQQMTNMNLIAKIHEDFIITLPAFKQGIVNAVLLKRQKLQADSLAELDRKTNEMLKRNAQTTIEVAKNSAALASRSSIDVETLEQTWNTIRNGIDEVNRIQSDAHKKREEDKKRLDSIKAEFYGQFGAPSNK